ncbi:hypothetical protein YTPLAS18_36190 [Nitrospira sp.]|nr:hypothetical protein YTPLAS18_36190 [Nitrospira sp.]
MSRRRDIDQHLHTFGEIGGILRAMRNIALMETQKLARFATAQQQSIDLIEAAAADFLNWHPFALARPSHRRPLYLLLGSERGFCGEFNDAVLASFHEHVAADRGADPILILVGSRLALHAQGLRGTIVTIQGPSVAEETAAVIGRLVEQLRALHKTDDLVCILDATVVHHVSTNHHSTVMVRRPFLGLKDRGPRHAYPPVLTLTPMMFAAELVDHYLFAILHDLLHRSLLSENQRRVRHMEQALQRLDGTMAELTRKRHAVRQEEITEEIETIMLSAELLGQGQTGRRAGNSRSPGRGSVPPTRDSMME